MPQPCSKTSRDGQKRFRCAEGWVSALTSKGTPLFQNLGEARLERAADATRREEAAANAEKDKERAKYAERAMQSTSPIVIDEQNNMSSMKKEIHIKRSECDTDCSISPKRRKSSRNGLEDQRASFSIVGARASSPVLLL